MKKTPHSDAIDKDIDDLGLFMAGVQGGLAAQERIARRDLEELPTDASIAEVEGTDKFHRECMKQEKEGRDAQSMFNRIRTEIKRLRTYRR